MDPDYGLTPERKRQLELEAEAELELEDEAKSKALQSSTTPRPPRITDNLPIADVNPVVSGLTYLFNKGNDGTTFGDIFDRYNIGPKGPGPKADNEITKYLIDRGNKEWQQSNDYTEGHPFKAALQVLGNAIFGNSPRSLFMRPTSEQIANVENDPNAPQILIDSLQDKKSPAAHANFVGDAAFGAMLPWSGAAKGAGFGARVANHAGNVLKNVIPMEIFNSAREAIGQKPETSIGDKAIIATIASALMSAPFLAGEGTKKLGSMFYKEPDKSAALLNAFRVSDVDAAPSHGDTSTIKQTLENLLDNGIIADPSKSNQPFVDTLTNSTSKLGALREEATNIIKTLPTTDTKELLSKVNVADEAITNASKASTFKRAIKSESDNIRKIAYSKAFPDQDPDEVWKNYLSLKKKASSSGDGSSEAKALLKQVDQQIDNTKWSALDVWKLRKAYDEIPKFDVENGTARSDAYKKMRTNLQSHLLDLAGGNKDKLDQTMKQMSSLLDVAPYFEKIAGREQKGITDNSEPIGKKVLSLVKLAKAPKVQLADALNGKYYGDSENLLRQAFGNTLGQQKVGPFLQSDVNSFPYLNRWNGLANALVNYEEP